MIDVRGNLCNRVGPSFAAVATSSEEKWLAGTGVMRSDDAHICRVLLTAPFLSFSASRLLAVELAAAGVYPERSFAGISDDTWWYSELRGSSRGRLMHNIDGP